MAKNRQADPEVKINYLVNADKGDFIIEIPAHWKVTFGAVNPGGNMSRHDLHCLRVWEGEKLRAVYCDIRGFRDLSIPMCRKVQAETRSSTWTMDSAGNFTGSTERTMGEITYEPEDPKPPEVPF